MDSHPSLHADLTPVVTEHPTITAEHISRHSDRILFGSDCPNTTISVTACIAWLTNMNVPDDVLRRLPANGGVVMVNFYPGHLSQAVTAWNALRAGTEASAKILFNGQPERLKATMAAWDKDHPKPITVIGVVADHIDHVANIAGHDHVGLGGDLDGIGGDSVVGLGGVDGYPRLFAELIGRGWSDTDLAKLAGGNILRAMRGVEATAVAMKGNAPVIATVDGK